MNAKTNDPQANTFCRIVAAMLIESARVTTPAPKRKRARRANGRHNRE
jgi:hypothetical protein